ncbi:hypothetical protein MMC13_004609 [Lambiella insularis]|nr:hypothetical protein [Lambiella insularis]
MPTKLNNKKSSAEFEKLGNSQDRIWGHIDVMSDSVAQTTLQVSSPTQYNRSKINDNSIPTGLRSHSPQAFAQSFDLAPPPPNKHLTTIDTLCERLFSDDHLYLILGDSTHFVRFSAFINKSKSQTALLLNRYLDTQKAIKAVEYANAVAHTIGPLPEDYSTFQPYAAASLDVRFEERSKKAFEGLVNEGLSSYVTRVLVDAVTDTLVKEITGNTMPIMRDLVAGLAEVFCLTDPSIEDNPIVYASEGGYPDPIIFILRVESGLTICLALHRILSHDSIWT